MVLLGKNLTCWDMRTRVFERFLPRDKKRLTDIKLTFIRFCGREYIFAVNKSRSILLDIFIIQYKSIEALPVLGKRYAL